MTIKEAKSIALDAMMESVSVAYYKITDNVHYDEEQVEMILKELRRYRERIGKALNTPYITY